MSEVNWSELESKAAELSTSKGRTIIPFSLVGDNEDDHVIGYMYEIDPLTDVKLMAAKIEGFEKSLPMAFKVMESMILWDESDKRMRDKKYMNGAALFLLSLVEIATPEFKKK